MRLNGISSAFQCYGIVIQVIEDCSGRHLQGAIHVQVQYEMEMRIAERASVCSMSEYVPWLLIRAATSLIMYRGSNESEENAILRAKGISVSEHQD